MQYWHLSLRDEVTLNCAHTHALHSAVRPRRGTHSLWRQTGNQANKPGFYTHLYFLACIIIDRDRDTEQLPFSRWRQGPNKNVKIYYKWTIRLLLSVIECTIYLSESCGSKQLEKKITGFFYPSLLFWAEWHSETILGIQLEWHRPADCHWVRRRDYKSNVLTICPFSNHSKGVLMHASPAAGTRTYRLSVSLRMSATFQHPTKILLPSNSTIRHAFFSPSHHLTQRRTNIQVHTYRADSDRTPSPGWVRLPFWGSSRPLLFVPSCAWDCSHVDVDRTVAATSGRGYSLPFLLPLLPVSLSRGGAVKELPGAVSQR